GLRTARAGAGSRPDVRASSSRSLRQGEAARPPVVSPAMATHTDEEITLWNWAQQWEPGTPALTVEDEEFEDCTFVGPGVLMFIGGVRFFGNQIEGDGLWVVDTDRGYQGAIAVRNCTFTRCRFVNVGLATDGAFVRQIYETQAQAH